jgi:assimilatory nitrate reductase catalytic subunit
VEIHPRDALDLGLKPASLAQLQSRWGSMLARVDISLSQQPGSLFVPMHWTGQLSNQGRVGALVNPVVDPWSGQPESKQTPVSIKAWQPRWQALVLSREPLAIEGYDYQVKIKGDGFWRYQLAGQSAIGDLAGWSRAILMLGSRKMGDCLEFRDIAAGDYRLAQLHAGQLWVCVFVTAEGELPEPGWLSGLFAKPELSRPERLSLLSGQPPLGEQDVGRTVCSCFNVGEKTILQSIKTHQLNSVAGIGECLGAGTGCGSCLSELKSLLPKACQALADG